MEPFLGQVSLFAFDRVPRGWLRCEGQLLAIRDNQALFALLGLAFGGNGSSTFGIPDLRGRVPVEPSDEVGRQGTLGGSEQMTLSASHLPAHSHSVQVSITDGTALPPTGNVLAKNAATSATQPFVTYALADQGTQASLAAQTVTGSGNGTAHENRQPSLTVCYCIAISGVFPSRP